MPTIDEIKQARLEKLKKIEGAGINAFPLSSTITHSIKEALDNFAKLKKGKKEIILAGRVRTIRGHGGVMFFDIQDGSITSIDDKTPNKIQGLIKKDGVGEKTFEFFLDNLDIGDFIEVKGVLIETKTKEKSIEVKNFKILAKALLPLPEKWHGIQDVEERFRKRYLDLIFNQDIKQKFIIRSKIVSSLREFLDKEGFLEVETPILQPLYGGATAKPFKTHLNAMDMELYLRIAPELYLKRLLVGGFDKVYEIGKCFRNEGMDKAHNPDFTMLEFYAAYWDYKELMKFAEKLLSTIIKNIFGDYKIQYEGNEINFAPPFPRVEYYDLLQKEAGIDIEAMNLEALKQKAQELGIANVIGGKPEIADEIYKKVIRPKIIQPTFLIHYPSSAFPLAKPLEANPEKSASFQLVAAGFEIVKAFSELNNPITQRERFKEQEKIAQQGFDEAQPMDEDFIEALEHGMPPAAGFGMGIDRLSAILTDSHSLREIILFPLMKPRG